MVPYTRESIAALRHAAAKHTPAAEIQQLFGWDGATLARVCRKHEIDLAIPAVSAAAPTSAASVPVPVPGPSRRRGEPDLAAIVAGLTQRQADIFRMLQPHAHDRSAMLDDEGWLGTTAIGRRLGVASKANSLRSSIMSLQRNLERMDACYQMESKPGRVGGYRLVIDRAAP